MLLAHSCPEFKSKVLMNQIGVFSKRILQDDLSNPLQLVSLTKALKALKNFKNDKLVGQILRKGA